MFKLIGIGVAIYTVIAVATGEVYAKSGPWGRKIFRREAPENFWVVVTIYGALSIALMTIF